MDISWADLDSDEQHTIAILGAGLSIELCNPLALMRLRRLGLVIGASHLTATGHNLRRDAVMSSLAAKPCG